MCNFRVGQKVVCVDALVWTLGNCASETPSGLREGEVYTIRAIRFDPNSNYRGINGGFLLDLEEAAPSKSWTRSIGFASARFRPVVERKTDISVFRAMLTPSKQKVEA